MSDLLREQVSAFMDGELPAEECALLLKRVAANAELAERWHAYHLIGDSIKGEFAARGAQTLAARVESALAEPPTPLHAVRTMRPRRRHMRRSATVAAGVAALGLAGLVGALVMRQVSGGGQVLVPGAASHPASGAAMRHVDWRQTPQPVRAELNRYLLMHEGYGVSSAPADHAALGAAASLAVPLRRGGGR